MKTLHLGLAILLFAAGNLSASDLGRDAKITVRTSTTLRSDRSTPGDIVSVVLVKDFVVDGKLIAPKGSRAEGAVYSSSGARRDPKGEIVAPGFISIKLERIDAPGGTNHLSTNQYTRQGRGRAPIPGRSTGISIDSVGGVQPQSTIPLPDDPTGISVAGGPEAIIPAQSIISFKVAAISRPGSTH